MALTDQDIKEIANLARLELTPTQIETYKNKLSAILEYAQELTALDLEDVVPTTHAVPAKNITRVDVIETPLSAEQITQNTTNHQDNQFVVQAVLDES